MKFKLSKLNSKGIAQERVKAQSRELYAVEYAKLALAKPTAESVLKNQVKNSSATAGTGRKAQRHRKK